jgi:hypothetical protein
VVGKLLTRFRKRLLVVSVIQAERVPKRPSIICSIDDTKTARSSDLFCTGMLHQWVASSSRRVIGTILKINATQVRGPCRYFSSLPTVSLALALGALPMIPAKAASSPGGRWQLLDRPHGAEKVPFGCR